MTPASLNVARAGRPRERADAVKVLCEIYAQLLGVEPVGPDSHFFHLGGHSLLAMQAAVRIEARLGVETPVSLLFEHPVVADLASTLETRDASLLFAAPPASRTQARDNDGAESSPLAPAERAMWFLDQAVGRRAAYLLTDVWALEGPLDEEALRLAFDAVVARHPALSARYALVNGEPRQMPRASRFTMAVRDLRDRDAATQDQILASLAADETERPVDLQHDCLLRATLLALADERHVLLVTLHHIASDASSQQLLRQELGERYAALRGRAAAFTAPAPLAHVRPPSVSRARRETLRSYWTHQLADLPLLELPADRRRLSPWTDNGAEMTVDIPASLTARLQQIAADRDVTLQMLLVTAYALLLGRYSGQTDFGIATFASDRRDPRLERAIGLFVNTVVLRADLAGAPTWQELLGRMRRTSLGAYDHRDYPFDALVSELRPDRLSGPNPLTPAAFQFLPFPDAPPVLEGLTVRAVPCPTRRIRFDLELTVRQEASGLRALVGYSTDLFDRETIARLTRHYVTLLESIAAAPDSVAADLSLLTEADRREQLLEWSGVATGGTQEAVLDLFDAQVRRSPDAPAVVWSGQCATYRALDVRATEIAVQLAAAGVHTGAIVAIYATRSFDMVAATVATLKAGAAYMPLDPSHPDERLAFMMRDAGAAALIADAEPPVALRDTATVVIRLSGQATAPGTATVAPRVGMTSPEQLAYVMYTSGSTGQPKGVAVPHRGITRLVRDTNYVRFGPDDTVACVSNPAFDAATLEIWGALLNGARLALFDRDTLLSPARLGSALASERVTVMFLTAALFRQIVAIAPGIFAPLRYLIVGGDVVDPAAAHAVLTSATPPRHLVNGYGPTENTTFSATFPITSAHEGTRTIPIGRPIAGSTCYVLDERQRLMPVGAVGELFVGGAGVALGYINQPERTRERFVEHPFIEGARLYRTGDRVRWRWDGDIEFLGRVDRQVKLRGHRIELEEIEHVLALHPSVTTCAVVADRRAHGDVRLIAYVAGRAGERPAADLVRRHLQQRVPAYMVPELVVTLEALPLTPNGKVDRTALPAPDNAPRHATHTDPPRATESGLEIPGALTEEEERVAGAFAAALGRARVSRDESFFDLGGDSFGAFRLAADLSTALNRTVPVSVIFEHPTVGRLTAALSAPTGSHHTRAIVEVRRGGAKPPVYFPPGVLGERMVKDELVEGLPADVPLYSLQDVADSGSLAPSLEAMAARFCAEIAVFQPEGPLCLAGYSFGGLIAYEMARQLKAAGREIRVLAIFDTGPDFSKSGSFKELAIRVGLCLANLPRWIAEDLLRSLGPETPGRLWRSVLKLVAPMVASRNRDHAAPGSVARVDHLFDVTGWSPAQLAYVENNLRILGAFQYRPYDGEVTLFRARVRPLFHALTWDLGWHAIARDVRVIETPGNHHTLMHDHIRVVAQKLRAVLET